MGEGKLKAGGKRHWAVTIITIKISASLGVICLSSPQVEAEDCEHKVSQDDHDDTLSQKQTI